MVPIGSDGLEACADSPIGCLRQAEGAEGKAEIKEAKQTAEPQKRLRNRMKLAIQLS